MTYKVEGYEIYGFHTDKCLDGDLDIDFKGNVNKIKIELSKFQKYKIHLFPV
jgi:hypothetical protein